MSGTAGATVCSISTQRTPRAARVSAGAPSKRAWLTWSARVSSWAGEGGDVVDVDEGDETGVTGVMGEACGAEELSCSCVSSDGLVFSSVE